MIQAVCARFQRKMNFETALGKLRESYFHRFMKEAQLEQVESDW